MGSLPDGCVKVPYMFLPGFLFPVLDVQLLNHRHYSVFASSQAIIPFTACDIHENHYNLPFMAVGYGSDDQSITDKWDRACKKAELLLLPLLLFLDISSLSFNGVYIQLISQ